MPARRPDMTGAAAPEVSAPTLLIVGGAALDRLPGGEGLEIISRAGHLFEQPGALIELARAWLAMHLREGAAA